MNVKIERIRPATDEEWDAIWNGCEYATFFHSREWAGIWHAYTDGKMSPAPQTITFSDGKKCLLPISSQKVLKGLKTVGISSPAGTFGGWISNDKLSTEHSTLITNYMISHY